ncbi:MAG: proline dehydrogenase family protein [Bacteroidota bacterium]
MPSIPHPFPKPDFSDTATAFAAKTDAQVEKAFWLFRAMNMPWLTGPGSAVLNWALKMHLPVQGIIKSTVFEQFCGGETIEECEKAVNNIGSRGVGTILDFSAEGEKTEAAFDAIAAETLATIERAAKSEYIPFGVFKLSGLARFALLEKMQSGASLSADERTEFARAEARVERICGRAEELGIRILIDGEETWIQDVIDNLCYRMMQLFNQDRCIVYNTFQMYRTESLQNLKTAAAQAKAGGYYFGAKPVRGAYMEKERARAARLGYADPIQPDKPASDRDYDAALLFCLDNIDRISLCAGTHNEASCMLLVNEMERRKIAPNDKRIYFSQLYGMSDNISFNLAKAGFNVAKYLPYGPVALVMPYLIRRANENTSVAGQSSREFQLIAKERWRRKKARA